LKENQLKQSTRGVQVMGTEFLVQKEESKEQTKSSPIHSAYNTKMIVAFNNTGKFKTKTLKKSLNKTDKIYYDQNYSSKSNDEKLRNTPLSLVNSFERINRVEDQK
jgi:hypothetical protein